jgi:hypothetical protein
VTSGPGTCLTPNLNSETVRKMKWRAQRDEMRSPRINDWIGVWKRGILACDPEKQEKLKGN